MTTPHLGLIGFSGLNLAYSLVLTIFRHSVYEIDNYPVSLTENALSGACFGAVYYLLNKNSQSLLIPGAISLFQFFLSLHVNKKYVKGKPYKKVELEGKVYIVTGCNTGIGYETARALVEMGATVIMACRSVDKANEARTSILAKVKCAPSKLLVLKLDLCSFDSVRQFVKEFEALGMPLNCLINNAGMMTEQRMTAPNGFEMCFTANHLSHFLLTVLLLPHLEKTSGRVVNLTSSVHNVATKGFNFDDVMSEKYYEMFYTYGQSKLANILFTKELQRRILAKGSKVACFSVHPGCVMTEVTRNMSWWMQLGDKLATPIMMTLRKTPPEGAYSSLYAATDVALYEDRSKWGKLLFHCKVFNRENPAGSDEVAAKKLWDLSEKLTGLK